MVNDGDFSAWNGHSPTQRVPTRRRARCSLAIWTKSVSSLTRATSSSTIPTTRRYLVPARSAPGLPQMAVEPLQDDLGPLHPVAGRSGAGQLVALAGEPHQLDGPPQQAEGGEELVGLPDGTAQVALGVDEQQWRGDRLHVGDGRMAEVG